MDFDNDQLFHHGNDVKMKSMPWYLNEALNHDVVKLGSFEV